MSTPPALGSDGKPLLQYPLDYPIKVVGRRDELDRPRIDAIVRRHAPDLTDDRIGERESREARFVSITYTIVARSREQIEALVLELSRADGVSMVI